MKTLSYIFIVFVLTAPCLSVQKLTFEEMGDEELTSDDFSSFSKNDLDKSARTILGLTLEKKLTLKDVMNKLGKAQTFETGDAAAYEKKVLYLVENKGEKMAISFASGEMGGGKNVTIVRVFYPKYFETNVNWGSTLNIVNEVAFENGLKLGVDKEQVLNLLGKPDKRIGAEFRYYFSHRMKVPKTDPIYDEYIKTQHGMKPIRSAYGAVVIKFDGDKAVFIEIERTEGIFD